MNPDWLRFAPRITIANCRETSPVSGDYNCLAYAAGDHDQWWEPFVIPPEQPGIYWPPGVPPDARVEDWEAALACRGYQPCVSDCLEAGLVKVAIYGRDGIALHAARQLKTGWWTSKLGQLEDIAHQNPDVLGGGDYGEVVRILARVRTPLDP